MKKQTCTIGLVIAVLCVASVGYGQGKGKGQDRSKGNRQKAGQYTGQGRKADESGKALAEEKRSSARDAGKRAEKPAKPEHGRADREHDKSGKGKGKSQQQAAVSKQIQHEKAKHLQRKARLQRILELATEKNAPKIIERVRSLMDKEEARYTKTSQRLQARLQKAGLEQTETQVRGKIQGTADGNKQKGKSKDKPERSSEHDDEDEPHEEDNDEDAGPEHDDSSDDDEHEEEKA